MNGMISVTEKDELIMRLVHYFVTKENYYGYICVNGHALKKTKSNNSNFAFISKINLTEPVTNTREYGESIAKIANCLGDSKPILQTVGDLV